MHRFGTSGERIIYHYPNIIASYYLFILSNLVIIYPIISQQIQKNVFLCNQELSFWQTGHIFRVIWKHQRDLHELSWIFNNDSTVEHLVTKLCFSFHFPKIFSPFHRPSYRLRTCPSSTTPWTQPCPVIRCPELWIRLCHRTTIKNTCWIRWCHQTTIKNTCWIRWCHRTTIKNTCSTTRAVSKRWLRLSAPLGPLAPGQVRPQLISATWSRLSIPYSRIV